MQPSEVRDIAAQRGHSIPTTPRRFTIAEGLTLVAATALGLAPLRPTLALYRSGWLTASPWVIGNYVVLYASLVTPTAAAWSIALAASSRRRPRADGQRLGSRPGAAAALAGCLGAVAAALIVGGRGATGNLNLVLADPRLLGYAALAVACIFFTPVIGFGVICAWATLAAVGRWRPEPSAIDRLGRALGVYWIVSGLVVGWILLGLVNL